MMRVQFWGTRGSIAKAGASTVRYGGNTSCVEVRSAGDTLVVLDCGTGAHGLGQSLVSTGPRPLRGHILISHTHWDHIQGLPFFAPLFAPGNEWDIYAPRGLLQSLRDTLAGQMQYTYFPITLEELGANIRYHDLVEGSFDIDDIHVRTHYLNHPALALGYRLEVDGVAVVYACDHEPHEPQLANGTGALGEQDQRHAQFLDHADLVIHDAQYTASEYAEKQGWGHSTVEYAVAVSQAAGVKRLALTHHDPLRDDPALDHVMQGVQAHLGATASSLQVFAAAEGQRIELQATATQSPEHTPDAFSAVTPMSPALLDHSVLLGSTDAETASILSTALRADDVRVQVAADRSMVLQSIASATPSLVLLEQAAPDMDALEVCRTIRGLPTSSAQELPIIVIASEEDRVAGTAAGVTDWLIKPFSSVYARTRLRAWLLRTTCRWLRAPIPKDEERRLTALYQLGILDTQTEERFDRLTRLASVLFDIPIVLVTLVDRDRQWFKSCIGLGVREAPRESSFCAHVVLSHEVMIIPDTLLDPRFADNPFVTGAPYIRFYAGYPLMLSNGSCVGTLCLSDVRPRQLDEDKISCLRDLAALVQHELSAATR